MLRKSLILLLACLVPACGDFGPGGLSGGVRASDVPLDSTLEDPYTAVVSCADGDAVFAAWIDSRHGGSKTDVYVNRSLDRGNTWLPTSVRINTDTAGSAVRDQVQISCSGMSVYVVWSDFRDGQRDIRFNRSLDGGLTWLGSDVRLDTDPAGSAASWEPQVACSGSVVHVVWYAGGGINIFYSRSMDSGATWLPANLPLNVLTNAGFRPKVACSGDRIYVVWVDAGTFYQDLYFNSSADGGVTWRPLELRIDTDAAGSSDSTAAVIACSGTRVCIAWEERDAFLQPFDIRVNVSSDGGDTWLPDQKSLLAPHAGSWLTHLPVVACHGARMIVAWSDSRSGDYDLRANRSLDGGATWLPSEVRVDRGPVGSDAGAVSLSGGFSFASSSDAVVAAWQDDRNGSADVRFNFSLNAGASWAATDFRADTDVPGASVSYPPTVSLNGTTAYFFWADDRTGTLQVRFNRTGS